VNAVNFSAVAVQQATEQALRPRQTGHGRGPAPVARQHAGSPLRHVRAVEGLGDFSLHPSRPALRAAVLGRQNQPEYNSVMDKEIRQGRDPEWRFAFEHHLGADARTRIRRAVNRGQSVADPNEAAVAAGLARRDQRAARRHGFIFLPIQVVFASVWLAWTLSPERRVPVAFLWLWAAIWIVLVGVAPFLIWWRLRIAHRAAEANDRVAHQADGLPGYLLPRRLGLAGLSPRSARGSLAAMAVPPLTRRGFWWRAVVSTITLLCCLWMLLVLVGRHWFGAAVLAGVLGLFPLGSLVATFWRRPRRHSA
jgi:hypothetical protein